MADPFEGFNKLVASIMGYPQIRRPALQQLFSEIDALLHQGIDLLLPIVTFVEDNICFQLAQIAISRIKSRKIYKGRWEKGRIPIGEGVEIGATNSKILGMGFDLFKLSRTSREIATPLVRRTLRSLHLSNEIYENILAAFVTETEEYCKTVEALTQEAGRLQRYQHDGCSDDELVSQMQKVSALIDQKNQIEAAVGCVDTDYFYGTVALVRGVLDQIRHRQNKILKAYLRLIPKTVREWANNEMDAMDLFQAGSMGLTWAISAFNYRSGAGFPNFARTWIRQRVQGSMKKSGGPLMRLPFSIWEEYSKIKAAEAALYQEDPTRTVTIADIAEAMNIDIRTVDQILVKIRMAHIVSLDDELLGSDETPITREATIPDETIIDREQLADQQELIFAAMQHLKPAERRLVCLRYGFLEGIDNNRLNTNQKLREMFRQLSCKTLLHRMMAERLDN